MPRIEAPLLEETTAPQSRSRVRRAVALLGALAVVGAVALCVVHFSGSSGDSNASHTDSADRRDPQTLEHTEVADEYAQWLLKYPQPEGLLLSEAEMSRRIKTFAANKQIINQHNERYAAGEETFNMTLGPFGKPAAFLMHISLSLPPWYCL